MDRIYLRNIVAVSIVAIALGGCTSGPPPSKQAPASDGGATAPAAGSQAATSQASVTRSGNTITITGNNQQTIPAIRFDLGAYIFKWSSTGAFMGITASDAGGASVGAISISEANGDNLFVVNNDVVKPGDITLQASSDGPWTITISKADASAAVELPQTLSGEELKSVVSKPFNASQGSLKVSYTYKGTPTGTGTVAVCNSATGNYLVTEMMTAGKSSGEFKVEVPATGVYIAKTTFPKDSKGGDVTISK